ncbi:HAMP domain protein [Candidatus Thiodiazotropha endolucinida]|uniref:HAMP domain protein n=1 Tax=Candidatus Thiodiazotropha endolucinida TaxID=1655433 RepID=A0A7Z0VQ59_9GAMM|nr:HAMP domain protein [Candidatus Thiodiazotropha endolucinida]
MEIVSILGAKGQDMGKFASKLRIGEKIGFGFGLVGLLFLGVIWQYHSTLQQSLADYQRLQDVYGAKKSYALEIENSMLEARRVEKLFLIDRSEARVEEVGGHVQDVLRYAEELGNIDQSAAKTSSRIKELSLAYNQQFLMIADAWRTKGLDHNSGLQGAFRDTVHELEAMAGRFKVGNLYLQLLQIRRGEKDLGLRREAQYRDRVFQLIEEYKQKLADSELEQPVQEKFLQEINTYRDTFTAYARDVLANQNVAGGKGPFWQAAHRLEALINGHYIPDLEQHILQLRRREKDYLLRGDKVYVDMALHELELINAQVKGSDISMTDKAMFGGLLAKYKNDFLALVEQNRRIEQVTEEMKKAVSEIAGLVDDNVVSANQTMNQMASDINLSSRENEKLMLWIVAGAVLLGIFFAITITLRIVHPLRKMAGILDQLAYEEPAERMPFVPEGRDEVNSMAESVNTMADHKARFIAWWKMSMEEADVCEQLKKVITAGDGQKNQSLGEAEKELLSAIAARRELLAEQYREISRLNRGISERAERLLKEHHKGESGTSINTIYHLTQSIRNILEMTATPHNSKAMTGPSDGFGGVNGVADERPYIRLSAGYIAYRFHRHASHTGGMGITMTGTLVWRMTRRAVSPIRPPCRMPWPRLPMTTRS